MNAFSELATSHPLERSRLGARMAERRPANLVACPAELRRAAGVRWPVLATAAAYADAIAWTEGSGRADVTGQSESGRWTEVLRMVSCATRRASRAGQRIGDVMPFQIWRLPQAGRGMRPMITDLIVVARFDDDNLPLLTVMLPDEVDGEADIPPAPLADGPLS